MKAYQRAAGVYHPCVLNIFRFLSIKGGESLFLWLVVLHNRHQMVATNRTSPCRSLCLRQSKLLEPLEAKIMFSSFSCGMHLLFCLVLFPPLPYTHNTRSFFEFLSNFYYDWPQVLLPYHTMNYL